MTALADALTRILAAARDRNPHTYASVGDLALTAWPGVKARPGEVVNVTARGRDLTNDDLDDVRAALAETGHVEIDSWQATQGASWLADGVSAGVSFRITGGPAVNAAERDGPLPGQRKES